MFHCCHRRAAVTHEEGKAELDFDLFAEEAKDQSTQTSCTEGRAVLLGWERLTRRYSRLAFKRRQWAFLGHLLNEIKEQGKELPRNGSRRRRD